MSNQCSSIFLKTIFIGFQVTIVLVRAVRPKHPMLLNQSTAEIIGYWKTIGAFRNKGQVFFYYPKGTFRNREGDQSIIYCCI